MGKRKGAVILTYNGVDGACAAAMALLKHPTAEVLTTSAARIGKSLQELAQGRRRVSEIHVCGVGVHCDWEEVIASIDRFPAISSSPATRSRSHLRSKRV